MKIVEGIIMLNFMNFVMYTYVNFMKGEYI